MWRYTNHRFPSYRHVPGETPHPERDPAGHSFGRTESSPKHLTLEDWSLNETYLYGIDLFNYGFYWEAHAEWERLWQVADAELACGLRALVQLAAALIQVSKGNESGARKLAARSRKEFAGLRLSGRTSFLGLGLVRLEEILVQVEAGKRKGRIRLLLSMF